MDKYNDEEFTLCKLEELQFEELTEEDKKLIETHFKRGPIHWIIGLAMIAMGLGFLVWAWVLSRNGIGYAVAVTILSLIFFAVSWTEFLRKPDAKAQGAIHGIVEAYRYEASKNDFNNAADYYADILFASSMQKVSNIRVPEGFRDKREGAHKDNHFPREGAEIIIYKCDSKYPYTFVYAECSKNTYKLRVKA